MTVVFVDPLLCSGGGAPGLTPCARDPTIRAVAHPERGLPAAETGSAANRYQIYYAKRVHDGSTTPEYTTPVLVPELNVLGGRNSGPFVSEDEHSLIFSHAYGIYETTR